MKKIASIFVLGVCLISCSPETPATLTLSANAIAISNRGDPLTIELTSNLSWKVSDLPDWLTLIPASGEGNTQIQVLGAPNTENPRTAEIRFISTESKNQLSATLKISQSNINFNLNVTNIPLDPAPTSFKVWITTDAEWSVGSAPDWVSVSPLQGVGSGTITIDVPFNNTQADRFGTVSLTYYDKTAAVNITQQGYALYADGEVLQYMQSSMPRPVILVFTGDGYTIEDCKVGGLFEQNAAEGIEALFSVEPYKSYRAYFSVYIVFAHSLERGASQVNLGITKQTAFGATFTSTTNSGTNMTADNTKAYSYAQKVPGMAEYGINNTAVFMMVNQDRYGGTCTLNTAGRSVAKIPVSRRNGNQSYASVLMHEGGGHGFGRLADEYVDYNTEIPPDVLATDRSRQNSGMYLNVDYTDDPQLIRWSYFLGLYGYDRVGIYQGAHYYRYGVWRAEETNCMINNIPYYNAVCRELIVKRILTISGEGYTFEKFLDRDFVRAPSTAAILEARAFDPQTFIPLAPPDVEI